MGSPSDFDSDNITPEMGHGQRLKSPSVLLKDFLLNLSATHSPPPINSSPSASSGTPYPLAHYINCDCFSSSYHHFIVDVVSGQEPKSFKESMTDERWKASMQEEIRALEDNCTWTLTSLASGKRALGSQWVYKIKYKSNGDVEHLKSRLVVFGNHQNIGVDYNETFTPVAKMITVRVFLAVATSKIWELHQMDVHNAFLHGNLTEVYMCLPPGFKSSNPNLMCRLHKSLYVLKQAQGCWFAKLVTALKRYGFKQSYSDYSLLTDTRGQVQVNVLVYVDDLIISGNNSNAICVFKRYLNTCFKMKDLGTLKYFLGIEVAWSPVGFFLYQRKYTLDIVTETGLLGAKLSGLPLEQNHKLSLAKGTVLADSEAYQRLVGRLIYVSVTRPNLSYSVHILSQFMQVRRIEHWEAALRVVHFKSWYPVAS